MEEIQLQFQKKNMKNYVINSQKIHVYKNQQITVSNGKLNFTHNLGNANYIATFLPIGALIPTGYTARENDVTVSCIWSPNCAPYSGTFTFDIIIML